MENPESKGNGTGQVAHDSPCDHCPDDHPPDNCPLVRRIRSNSRKIASIEGTDAQIREFMKDPEKLWQALNDLEVEFEQLTSRIDGMADEVSKVAGAPGVSIEEIGRIARWQKTILILTMIIGVLALGAMGFFDHQFDGLWNHLQGLVGG